MGWWWCQIGFDQQLGAFVYGLEADLQYTGFRDARNVSTTALNGVNGLNNSFQQELKYLGTFRGRFGVAADRALFYVTGGLAYGRTDNSVSFSGPLPAAAEQFAGKTRHTNVGYTLGGGIEYAFTNSLSLKAEYLYYDLGSDDVYLPGASVALPPGGVSGMLATGYNTEFRNNGHIVRGGFNWRLGAVPMGPVAARY